MPKKTVKKGCCSSKACCATKKTSKKKGFTLVEMLLVIAIIAIIASVIFVALDPLKRFKDSRDSKRITDVSALIGAIKLNQIDNKGKHVTAVENISSTTVVYMITDGNVTSGCNAQNTYCETPVTSSSSCVDLSGLVAAGSVGKVPVSPNGDGSWSESISGYTLQKNANGTITIRSCESENTSEIFMTR